MSKGGFATGVGIIVLAIVLMVIAFTGYPGADMSVWGGPTGIGNYFMLSGAICILLGFVGITQNWSS